MHNKYAGIMRAYTVPIIFTILIVIRNIVCVDWTLNCSINCKCKWMSGKKSATCTALGLTTLPANLSTEIQVLTLNDNNIQTLNREEFTTLGLVNLQRIYLKNSSIKYLHKETFKNLKILVELDLSENQIEQLDKQTFAGNDRLRIIYLYSNPIKQLIADQFPVLPYLRTIDLHNCQLTSIDETAFSNIDLLEYLNLKHNQLQTLPGNIFTHMKNLKTLVLEENPWHCDCKLKKFRNWYIHNNLNRVSMQCKTPYSATNQNWESLADEHFGCPPVLKILKEDIHTSDLESNITFRCYAIGDPKPTVTWELDGREIDNDNVIIDNDDTAGVVPSYQQPEHGKIWSNLSIYNITNLNAGFYTCSARNNVGFASQNISLILPEVADHVLIKNSDTFWYFGLILGIFGTVLSFLLISIAFCVCRKVSRMRKSKKNIKSSVSFNDQEKKLLDLSITTNNDRQDYDMVNTPSTTTSMTNKTDSSMMMSSLEPVQITIENFHHHPSHMLSQFQNHHQRIISDEYPLNITLFPPPPAEFCSPQSSMIATTTNGQMQYSNSISGNGQPSLHHHQMLQQQPLTANKPPFGNIFISVSLNSQDPLDNDMNMYPDLLNIPNRVKNSLTTSNLTPSSPSALPTSQIVPINIESYATLPRNKMLSSSGKAKGPVSILKNSCKNYEQSIPEEACVAGLLMSSKISELGKCVTCNLGSRHDNMGPRVTASGNSTLSIPDDERDEQEAADRDEQSLFEQREQLQADQMLNLNFNHHLHHPSHRNSSPSPPPVKPTHLQLQPCISPPSSTLMPNDFVSL